MHGRAPAKSVRMAEAPGAPAPRAGQKRQLEITGFLVPIKRGPPNQPPDTPETVVNDSVPSAQTVIDEDVSVHVAANSPVDDVSNVGEGDAFVESLRRGEDATPLKGVVYINRPRPWRARWREHGNEVSECFARASLANARVREKNLEAVRRILEGGNDCITVSRLNLIDMPAPTHIMPWDFDDIVENAKSKGYLHYKEHDMPLLGLASCGNIVENAVKRFFSSSFEVRDANRGFRVNGDRRSASTSENDFILVQNNIDRRAEVKSALLHWNNAKGCWRIQFEKIKPKLHDVLILVVIDVDRLHIFQRNANCTTGNTSSGVSTDSNGHQIGMEAPTSAPEFSDAMKHVCKSLEEQGELLGCVKFDDESYKDIFAARTPADRAYANIPFAGLHGSTRGDVAEAVGRLVHSRHLPKYHSVIDAASGTRCDGRALGRNNTSHDFGVQLPNDEALKIEMKSCMLCYERNTWVAQFEHVKFDEFDILLLALTTPRAIHVINYDTTRKPFVSTNGKSVTGDDIQVYGRSHADILTSADDILKKLTLCGCEYLYRIDF